MIQNKKQAKRKLHQQKKNDKIQKRREQARANYPNAFDRIIVPSEK